MTRPSRRSVFSIFNLGVIWSVEIVLAVALSVHGLAWLYMLVSLAFAFSLSVKV